MRIMLVDSLNNRDKALHFNIEYLTALQLENILGVELVTEFKECMIATCHDTEQVGQELSATFGAREVK